MEAAEIKKFLKRNILLIVSIILISFFSFQLGKLSKISGKESIIIKQESAVFKSLDDKKTNYQNSLQKDYIPAKEFKVVVSRNSNKYHYPWCPGAKRIKPENQIWFDSAQKAEKAGYIKAKNCNL